MPRARLLTQVLVVNLLLVAVAVIAAALASAPESDYDRDGAGIVLGFAVALSVLVNYLLLSRRTAPLEQLADDMEHANLAGPGPAIAPPAPSGASEIERLRDSFERMLARLEAERRQSAASALEAQERERARVALDLHDEVNQALTGLILRIEALRARAPQELSADLAETAGVASRAMEELLTLARQLRPSSLDDLGLVAALAGLCEELDNDPIRVRFESAGSFEEVSPETALVTYRIAQEALSNAIRHSGAVNVRVRLLQVGDGLELRVTDDGRGFSFDETPSGLGLEGMRERAFLVGGRIEIESRPKLGTRVRLLA